MFCSALVIAMRSVMKSLLCLCFLCTLWELVACATHLPDADRDVPELISSKGYPVSEYSVTTEDGFILGVQRIPGRGPPVVLWHGVFQNAASFVSNNAQEDIAFILYDAGFDVWLPNQRGSKYSQRHVKYTTKDKEFWMWSVDQLAADTPAVVDFVLEETGYDSLAFVGHSMGCSGLLAWTAEHPEFSKKISVFYALAPAIYLQHSNSPLFLAAEAAHIVDIFEFFHSYSLDPNNAVLKELLKGTCEFLPHFCLNVFFVFCGFNVGYINETRMEVYSAHVDGTSTMTFKYGIQIINQNSSATATFPHYDYGSASANIEHYGQSWPPLYDLLRVAIPTVLYYGGVDDLVHKEDIEDDLIPAMNPEYLQNTVFIEDYNHGDFIYGVNAHERVYAGIVTDIRRRSFLEKSVVVHGF